SSGMLIIVDDMHKARDSIIELFHLLKERCRGSSGFKFLVGTRRSPDFYSRKDLLATGPVREMELGGLDPRSSGELLSERGIPEEEHELAYRLTKGHPLALELYTPGTEPTSSGHDLDDYLREEVLGELQENEMKILRTASVYESPVVAEGLFHGERPDHDLLSDLCKRALLRAYGDGTYDLHDLLKENLRKGMTDDERDRALSLAVDHLSRRGSEREIIHYLRILEGYDQGRMTKTLLDEGEFLVNRGHNLVYDLLETVREGELEGMDLVKYLVLYSDLKVRKGDLKGAEERLERALSLCDSLLDGADDDDAKHEIIGLVSRVLTRRGEISRTRGLHAATIDINRKNVAYNRKYGDAAGLGKALNNLAVAYNDRGELDKALETLENAREVFEKSGDPTSAALVEANIADIHITRRDTDRALKHLDAAASHSPKIPLLRGKLKRKCGLARLRLGDLDGAHDDLSIAYSSFSEAGDREGCREVAGDLFRWAMAAGRRKEALHFLEKGKELLKLQSEGEKPSGEPLVHLLGDRFDYTLRWDRKKGQQRARDLGKALGKNYTPKKAVLYVNSLVKRYDEPGPLIELLEELGSCFEGLADPHPGIIVDLRRGELLLRSGRVKEARTVLKKTASRARKAGFEKGWKKADSLLKRIK
ncbi:MAG: tetratricopeptide repeat protein, partial [Thermoplasmatota archaeon]